MGGSLCELIIIWKSENMGHGCNVFEFLQRISKVVSLPDVHVHVEGISTHMCTSHTLKILWNSFKSILRQCLCVFVLKFDSQTEKD